MPGKGRRVTGRVLLTLLGLLFAASAAGKLTQVEQIRQMFTAWGLQNRLILIGIGELVSALLLLIPRTSSLGILLLSAYLGGAIVTHMQHAEAYLVPAVLLALLWVAGLLRYPELLQSFRADKD